MSQQLFGCHKPEHRSNNVIHEAPAPRSVRKGVVEVYRNVIDSAIQSSTIKGIQGKAIKELHTKMITDIKDAYASNKVFDERAPPININKKSLPRSKRSTLSELKSGYCRLLNNYLSKYDHAYNGALLKSDIFLIAQIIRLTSFRDHYGMANGRIGHRGE